MIMLDFMEETQGTKEASAIAGALDVGQCRMTTELQEGNKLGNLGKETGTANSTEAVPSSPRAPCGNSSSATFC